MRSLRILAALTVAFAASATNANAGLLNRGCGCDAPPKCCAPEPSCCGPKINRCRKFGGRLKGMFARKGCGCDVIKDDGCGMDKGCGMEVACGAPAKACNPCRPRIKLNLNLKGMFRRGCADKGCDKGCAPEPKCGMDVSCGCDKAPKCRGPSLMDRIRSICPKRSCSASKDCGCGIEPACGWGK